MNGSNGGGFYGMPTTIKALNNRLDALINNPKGWLAAMLYIFKHKKLGPTKSQSFFRWHDSGDLQQTDDGPGGPCNQLDAIIDCCLANPSVKHWLPTKEYGYLKTNKRPIPENLIIRVSSPMKNQPAMPGHQYTSSAYDADHIHLADPNDVCPSSDQGNKCLDCRRCWSQKHIVYKVH